MKFLLRKQTKETKTRQKRFFAFMLSVLICCLPTATVLADNILIPIDNSANVFNNQIGKTVETGDVIYGSGIQGQALTVTYKSSKGEVDGGRVIGENIGGGYTIETKNGFTKWKIIAAYWNDYNYVVEALNDTPQPVQPVQPVVEEEKSEKKHYQQTPTSWLSNPNEISAFYYKDGKIDMKGMFGKAEQGEACKASFSAALPPMWKQAFTFSMSYDGKHTTDLKDGTLVLYIPPDLQKSGREFAILAIDKYGLVHTYYDTDTLANVFTTKLGFEGYAFALIYKD